MIHHPCLHYSGQCSDFHLRQIFWNRCCHCLWAQEKIPSEQEVTSISVLSQILSDGDHHGRHQGYHYGHRFGGGCHDLLCGRHGGSHLVCHAHLFYHGRRLYGHDHLCGCRHVGRPCGYCHDDHLCDLCGQSRGGHVCHLGGSRGDHFFEVHVDGQYPSQC